ncbi:MAG TPA: TRAP transporter substrate-binding protein [Syntrophales bacterium]|nr:TRAP transporter substrate-binding protein [Syntrophales bacterium]
MSSKLRIALGLVVVAALLVVALPVAHAAGQKLTISHNASLDSPWQKACLSFAEIINSKSGGKFNAEVFGNGVLFQRNWQLLLEMTQSGANQIGVEAVSALGSKVPEISAMSLPFLYADMGHVVRFLDLNAPVWKRWLYDGFEAKNLVVLGITPRPFRQLNNNKVLIKTPDDMKGLKFRVPANPFFVKIFESLGAKPVPLPSGEIYTAIQLGTVVGEDNSIPVQYDFKTHEVAKNFTIWNYIADASILFMNKDAYYKLSDSEKAMFKDAAKEWGAINLKEDTAYTLVARAAMEKAGVKFYEMPDPEKGPFRKLVEPVYADFAKQVGSDNWKGFLDAVEKTRKP